MELLFAQANRLLTSVIVIVTVALILYILTYNRRNMVARSFITLLLCVTFVYLVDLIVFPLTSLEAILPWLRLQWVGIAFAPAAYLHFSDALLQTTNAASRWRRWAVAGGYLLGLLWLIGVATTDLIVRDGVATPGAPHLKAGPLFGVFALYYFFTVVWGAVNINRARQRCLTSTSRRRMTYMALSFVAPGVGIFPYLLIASWPGFLPQITFWFLLVTGNVAVLLMLILLAYSVAYFGVLTPDRVVKRRMILYLLRGPMVASAVLTVIVIGRQMEEVIGIPGDLFTLFAVATVILTLQVLISRLMPLIDRLVYREDREEVARLQALDERLLTSTDLRQFLENVLTGLCDLLRTPTGFIAVLTRDGPRLEVVCGPLEPEHVRWTDEEWDALVTLETGRDNGTHHLIPMGDFFLWDGFWLRPLRSKAGDVVTGVLGLSARAPRPDFTPEEQADLETLIAQAEVALEDWHLQHAVFAALDQLVPEIEAIQRQRGRVRYAGVPAVAEPEEDLTTSPDFPRWVKDALSHYWGGPKLSRSPLLQLRVVQGALPDHDGDPVKALRAVLLQAIERLRPEGEREMTRAEWLLYNILEMKFLQGRRVRDVAHRLAMSESDLYRKQRVAIEEVARNIAAMEREALTSEAHNEGYEDLQGLPTGARQDGG